MCQNACYSHLDGLKVKYKKDVKLWLVEEKQKNKIKALTQIHLHLSKNILQDVLRGNTAAILWLKLE